MKIKNFDKEEIIEYKKYLSDYLTQYHDVNINKFFQCLNPNHPDNNPSMRFSRKYNICKCFSCGARYDIYDLMKLDYNCETFSEQVEKISNLYNCSNSIVFTEESEEYFKIVDYTNYFKYCYSNIDKSNYLEQRGISKELIEKYFIGYDKSKERIVFPINNNSYFGRNIKDNFKMKSKGKSYLWNEELLNNTNENTLIYLTESIIDSLSLETLNKNIKTVSLNGLYNTKRLLHLVKEKNYKGYFVLAFDNDCHGLEVQKKSKKELADINVNSFSVTLISNFDSNICKDINEALLQDKEKLSNNLKYFNEIFYKIINKNNKEEVEYEI